VNKEHKLPGGEVPEDSEFDSYSESGDSDNEDEDSNEEDNWRNEYPEDADDRDNRSDGDSEY